MNPWHVVGALAGHSADRLLGEPPLAQHPVALAGRALSALEEVTYRPSRAAGVVHLALGSTGAALLGAVLAAALGAGPATTVAVGLASAGRMLGDEAAAIGALLASGDLEQARARLPALVGRSPDDLGEAEIVRAVVESVAENTVDAVTASIFWGQAVGPIGVCVHRLVNTLDAMVGHRSARYQRFGWASARLDDLLGYVPARLTVLAVVAARPSRASAVLRAVRTGARRHPSPNGGIIEAAFAGSLGVTLGGVNRYGARVEDRGRLGEGPAPTIGHITAAVRLSRRASLVMALVPPALLGVAGVGHRAPWRRSAHSRSDPPAQLRQVLGDG